MPKLLALLLSILALPASLAMAETLIFSDNFNSGPNAAWTNQAIGTRNGETFSGHFANNSQSITLATVAGHSYRFDFELHIFDTMDGSGDPANGGCCGPDTVHVEVDGVEIFSETPRLDLHPNNSFGRSVDVDYPGSHGHYNISLSAVASASTISFHIFGTGMQEIADESWGVDDFSVSDLGTSNNTNATPVPEPASWVLLSLVIGVLFTSRKSK